MGRLLALGQALHNAADKLDLVNLVASRATAQAWCDANGVSSVAFLKEVEMEDELIAALKLKAGPAKKLAKDIRDYAPAAEPRAKRSRR